MAKEKKLKKKDKTKIDVSGDAPKLKKQKTREIGRGMPVEKDSYIIVKVASKNFLCLAINPERGRAVIDATLIDDEPKTIEFDEQNLVAVLGTKPKPGSAYGVKINPYISSVDTKYGPIHFYRELNEREMKSFKKALKATYAGMIDNHMDVFPFSAMRVFPKRGKYAGMYEIRRKGSEIWDRVDLFPETFEDAQWNEYLLYHEYGHAVWYKMVESRTKARWIKMFHKRIELTNFLKERLESLLDELLNYQDGDLKDFQKELDDESKLVFKEVLAHYKKYHKLDGRSLAILFTEDSEKFASMWPKRSTIVESKADPSEYALTKPEEFFAECFAFHMAGRKMSSDIVKLMEKTLIQIKGQ
ncbi:hypothetical protein D3C85_537590 [compost metagenome]